MFTLLKYRKNYLLSIIVNLYVYTKETYIICIFPHTISFNRHVFQKSDRRCLSRFYYPDSNCIENPIEIGDNVTS